MYYSKNELNRIRIDLNFWDLTDKQRDCVENLIEQAEEVLKFEEYECDCEEWGEDYSKHCPICEGTGYFYIYNDE